MGDPRKLAGELEGRHPGAQDWPQDQPSWISPGPVRDAAARGAVAGEDRMDAPRRHLTDALRLL